ncbi:MAG TPA: molybdenum cofactor biosynthesis protein MoaE [Planctomycetota bacterium]|nr:molybdenum cofactor biosynthesis protein MoaE [Planctomycetota bacterium]
MPEPWILVTEAALDDAAARRFVAAPSNGAVLVFHGVVRDRHEGRAVTRVEYSAYEAMAESELREVARETAREHGVEHLAVFHRLGPVAVGEASLVVAVGAPHRAAAFACGLATIDRLKARAPVFKKEIGPDGARWQEGVLPEPAP